MTVFGCDQFALYRLPIILIILYIVIGGVKCVLEMFTLHLPRVYSVWISLLRTCLLYTYTYTMCLACSLQSIVGLEGATDHRRLIDRKDFK